MVTVEPGILEVLKGELAFIESRGYANRERGTGKRLLMLRDSPTCLGPDPAPGRSRCDECPLMEFVPPAARSEKLPCQALPVGPEGETVEQVAAHGDRGHLAQLVAQWLKSTIRRVEQAQRTIIAGGAARAFPKPQVLIVDDDGGMAIVLKHLLEGEGYDVTSARDGQTALRDLGRHAFNLVLMNDYLPDISAEAFLRRAVGLEPPVPILLMQSGPLPGQMALKYAQLGVRFFISKHIPKQVAGLAAECLDLERPVKTEPERLGT